MSTPSAPDPSTIRAMLEQGFRRAAFVNEVGIRLVDGGAGWCEAELPAIEPRHLQHTGVVHAGVITTLADHCAGGAGQSLCAAGEHILTAEFKVNLLRPGKGERLSCRAQVLKPGKAFHVVEAEVHAHQGDSRVLVAKLNTTLAVVRG